MFFEWSIAKSSWNVPKNSAIFTYEKVCEFTKFYKTIWLQPHQLGLFTAGLIWFWFEKKIFHTNADLHTLPIPTYACSEIERQQREIRFLTRRTGHPPLSKCKSYSIHKDNVVQQKNAVNLSTQNGFNKVSKQHTKNS